MAMRTPAASTSSSTPAPCHGFYDRPSKAIFLYNDAFTAPLSPGTLQNSQCAIEGTTSSVALSGFDAVLNLTITRKGAFATTAKKLFVWITGASALGTGWVQASQWNP